MLVVSLKALMLQKMGAYGKRGTTHQAHTHFGGVRGENLNPQALLWTASWEAHAQRPGGGQRYRIILPLWAESFSKDDSARVLYKCHRGWCCLFLEYSAMSTAKSCHH